MSRALADGTRRHHAAAAGALAVLSLLVGCGRLQFSDRDAGRDFLPFDVAPADAADASRGVSSDASPDRRELGSADSSSPPDTPASPDTQALSDAADGARICSGICNAATPVYPTVGSEEGQGNITMYTTEPSTGGACNYGPTGVRYFVAVNVNLAPGDGRGQWQGGRSCGQCVEVTALTSQGPRSVVVRIMDKCPDGFCGMDLGGAAPAAVMSDGFGRYDGSWRFVSCSGHPEVSDGPASLFVVAGANAYWSRVQIRNPPGAVTGITWTDSQGGSGAFAYASDPENTFEVPTSLLQSKSASLTVTARFTDGSEASLGLSPADLAVGGASYPLR
jgi:hypothetical protein